MKIPAASLLVFLLFSTCKIEDPGSFDLPTKICVRTQHHHQPIPAATIFVKYNTDTFPGWEADATRFDAVFKTGKDARGCLAPVPEGRHWLVAHGYDSLYFPHEVRGSLRVEVSLAGRATVDTVLYVSE